VNNFFVILMVLLCSPAAWSENAKSPPTTAPAAAPAPAPAPRVGERSKNVSFEDSVVEGMNRNPLDSLEHIDKRDHSKRTHLYQRRGHFKKELKDASKSTGYLP
jgi:hypothetical protein